ncbi:MAG: TetR/AcrR family transcriptional regulator [Bdellovibrionales bacterium]|nr:TetR/AcrR family transcriptional regulator [Bdellovibrionales bacterium]
MNLIDLENASTKEKILDVSRKLFAKYGFEGTSIRDIAKESGVNVSAVNYHFKNKAGLFWHNMVVSYEMMESQIEIFSKKCDSAIDLCMSIYDHFYQQSDALRSTMRMLLSESLDPPEDPAVAQRLTATFGPPGGRFIAAKIQQEIPYKFDDEGIYWAVKTIFGSIFHWSMMCKMAHIKKGHSLDYLIEPKQIRKDVERLITATLEYIKNHKEIFDKE